MQSNFICADDNSRVFADYYDVGPSREPKCIKIQDMARVDLAVAIRFGQRVDGIPNYIYPVKYTLTGGNMDVKYSCSGVRYLYDRFNITVSCWIVNDYMVFIKKLSGSVGI